MISRFTGTFRTMAVSGSLTMPGTTFDLATGDCISEIGDIEIRDTQPHAFVLNNTGVLLDCFWETPEGIAHLFAINDNFGTFAEASLEVPGEHMVSTFAEGDSVTFTVQALSASLSGFDSVTRTEASATVVATIEALEPPVASTFTFQTGHQRVTERRLIPSGTLTFSTGDVFTLDGEVCFGSEFDSHVSDAAPSGPKPGARTALNDTPDGAVPLTLGKVVNDQTVNTAAAPELQVETCPEPDDRFGHTLWYSFTGTGGPVTIDTSGSNFDTVIAVYDASLNELACNDDVEFAPIGGSLQAALTIDTVAGVTYLIQAGGFDPEPFFPGEPNLPAEFGRLRLRVG
jgi:hypothetical protein